METETTCGALPLFVDYPRLKESLPHVELGRFPTPVERLSSLGAGVGVEQLYIKRDDLSGGGYGGNKVRKLEFLLGAALRRRARRVITIGFAGSNHAVATAYYARQLGLGCTSLLLPQVNAHYARRNLLAGFVCGAKLVACRNTLTLGGRLLANMLGNWRRSCTVLIPAGGSCPLGIAGYVNAALELRDQIVAGQLPAPDRIYVPLGSMGTAVGLALGLQAAGVKTQVVAVRVIEARLSKPARMRALFRHTQRLLQHHDPAFPKVTFSDDALRIDNRFLGPGYARFTEAGVLAARLLQEQAGIVLNGAYSAKAAATLLADAHAGVLRGKVVLFWNTYNSRDLAPLVDGVDYRQLPRGFHRYFEEEVQPLDRPAVSRSSP